MSLKRNLAEALVRTASLLTKSGPPPENPRSIFVLRNNDIGDLLVVTPLFEALKRRYPSARLIAGVGAWSKPVLENNPHVDEIFPVTSPWHTTKVQPQTEKDRFGYIWSSPEVAALREKKIDIGVDVLGSHYGSLMLMRAGIPTRIGVRGYAGGHSGCWRSVDAHFSRYVGRSALVVAELLGLPESDLPPVTPRLYLTAAEEARGEALWNGAGGKTRLIAGFSGGFPEKCWPIERFRALLEKLDTAGGFAVKLVGGPADAANGDKLAAGLPGVENLAGKVSLRETFALASAADQVLTNPSMLMHVAAAFSKPAVVPMGAFFTSVAEHNALWICSPLTVVLGIELKDGRDKVAEVAEVFDLLLDRRTAPAATA